MNAGQLNSIIKIQQLSVVKGAYGEETRTYTDFVTTRAKVVYDGGSRTDENDEIVHNYSKSFVIRMYHQVNENMIVVYDGGKYRILSIEKNRDLQQKTLRTELINE